MKLHFSGFRVVFLIAALLLTACTPAVPEVTPAPGSQDAPGAVITIRVATGDTGEGLIPHRAVIKQFEAANPGIHVEIQSVPSDDYYGYLLQEIAAGSAPDVMQIGDDAVPMFVRRGALVELNSYMRGPYPLDPSIYLPGVFQPGGWDGKQYLLPKDFSSLAVYYNKRLFDAHGVTYPRPGWTWADFLNTARALTIYSDPKLPPDLWGVQLPGAWTGGFEYWAAAEGGQLVSEDGKRFVDYMDGPAVVSAARFYQDLYGRYHVAPPPVDITQFGGGNHEFADGKAAMMISGRWPQAELRNDPHVDLGVVGMPSDIRRANVLFWSGFGVAASSAHKDAAWRFIRFAAGEQAAATWAQWGLPTVKSTAEQLGLAKDPFEGVWLAELSHLTPRAYVFTPDWNDTADPPLQSALAALLQDPGADTTAILRDAAGKAQDALDSKK